jgi:2-Cys peroxiredoxin 5
LDLSFDGASIFGGDRSKRYALVIENGAVKEAHVESDNTGLNGTPWLVLLRNQMC